MKKSLQTVLTAAAFTASLNSAVAVNVNAATSQIPVTQLYDDEYDPSLEQVPTAYGPPWMFDDNYDPSQEQISTAYGPPWMFDDNYDPSHDGTYGVYGPPPTWMTYPRGDLNLDNEIDVFDMIKLKEMLLDPNREYDRLADANDDGEFGIADVVAIENYLAGRTIDYLLTEEQEELITTVTQPEVTTDTTTIEKIVTETTTDTPVTSYGPPACFFRTSTEPINTFDSPIRTTETTAIPKE